jgi:20S proteasome alpha/beta subunit
VGGHAARACWRVPAAACLSAWQVWGGALSALFVRTCGCRFGPWFVEPVIAGLEGPEHKPFISAMDLVGCPVFTTDFVVGGTCTPNMYGMCESLYRPDMVRCVSVSLCVRSCMCT